MSNIRTINKAPMNPIVEALLKLEDRVKELEESRESILKILEHLTDSSSSDLPRS